VGARVDALDERRPGRGRGASDGARAAAERLGRVRAAAAGDEGGDESGDCECADLVSVAGLTCDLLVTYDSRMNDDDRVFKALADPTRRLLLDRLFERDGRTLTDLEAQLDMTRFGVMKHLRVLEDAGLVVARKAGREKHHFLNPVPIRQIYERWIDKYTERRASALVDLKTGLEER
jgi:DNA-binding transcriptional ArsR family regulator